ncbi:transaldolase [Glacieibacterium megasporae]|uniref:transaldolase n=1 Tax=Glacieibacterium megasporae TaxID=2835787 RepID=UPI001C1E159F|nr:transaldolase [Polymorphobacter megasporae]UAJ12791.1 transaldolase [Polymorphobacter megasporae]
MPATAALSALGQSLWLDNITRDLLDNGTLQVYIDTLSVTGLTSNPTIFDKAIAGSAAYDAEIRQRHAAGGSDEDLFFNLAIADLRRAADLFAPVHAARCGVDGFVSLEVSPRLAHDTDATIAQAKALHARAARANLFMKIPGTAEGLPAISECLCAGVPVNVTLLFSVGQYRAAVDAWLTGLERRVEMGMAPDIASVASLFVSRWDVAIADKVDPSLRNTLGIAVAGQVYRAYREMMASDRFQRLQTLGARPQRLLFASTGTKDPGASDTLYVDALAAPNTINTMPEKTLRAYCKDGRQPLAMVHDAGAADAMVARHAAAGIDIDALGTRLQDEGAGSFVASWESLLAAVAAKRAAA